MDNLTTHQENIVFLHQFLVALGCIDKERDYTNPASLDICHSEILLKKGNANVHFILDKRPKEFLLVYHNNYNKKQSFSCKGDTLKIVLDNWRIKMFEFSRYSSFENQNALDILRKSPYDVQSYGDFEYEEEGMEVYMMQGDEVFVEGGFNKEICFIDATPPYHGEAFLILGRLVN